MDSEILLIAGAYFVGYGLLYTLAKVAAAQFKLKSAKRMRTASILLHCLFIACSLPAMAVFYYLFAHLKEGRGELAFVLTVTGIALVCMLHLLGVVFSCRYVLAQIANRPKK
jgi:hypothetical protein